MLKQERWVVQGVASLRPLDVSVPGDKSISHRALIFAALADGITHLSGVLESEDCLHTVAALRQLGVSITVSSAGNYTIQGRGVGAWVIPAGVHTIDCGNSGTLMRLLCGLLAGQPGQFCLVGDTSLSKRPMDRVANLLAPMGAQIRTTEGHAPVWIEGSALTSADITLSIPSAQLKTAVLLAALRAPGVTTLRGALATRDHSERWLQYIGYPITYDQAQLSMTGCVSFQARDMAIPGDFSHAAFLMVAAALTSGTHLTIRGVGVNPYRTGLIVALKSMGAMVTCENEADWGAEPVATIRVTGGAPLKGVVVPPEWVSNLIDELPVFAIAAAAAEGRTVVTEAVELRVKESDRIVALVRLLKNLGIQAVETAAGFEVIGGGGFRSGTVDSLGDHRIAMSAVVAAQVGQIRVRVNNVACVATSFPDFRDILDQWGVVFSEENSRCNISQ